MQVAHVSGQKLYLVAFVKKAKQRLQQPLKAKMHNSAFYGLILLKFCLEIAQVSGQKLYLAAVVKKGQTKASKVF